MTWSRGSETDLTVSQTATPFVPPSHPAPLILQFVPGQMGHSRHRSGRKCKIAGEGGGGWVTPGGGGRDAGQRRHFWLVAPVQSQICSRVPSAELGPVASRHLLAWGFTMSPAALNTHFCAPVPLQS